jgi:hypothetical protein
MTTTRHWIELLGGPMDGGRVQFEIFALVAAAEVVIFHTRGRGEHYRVRHVTRAAHEVPTGAALGNVTMPVLVHRSISRMRLRGETDGRGS